MTVVVFESRVPSALPLPVLFVLLLIWEPVTVVVFESRVPSALPELLVFVLASTTDPEIVRLFGNTVPPAAPVPAVLCSPVSVVSVRVVSLVSRVPSALVVPVQVSPVNVEPVTTVVPASTMPSHSPAAVTTLFENVVFVIVVVPPWARTVSALVWFPVTVEFEIPRPPESDTADVPLPPLTVSPFNVSGTDALLDASNTSELAVV